MKYLSILCLMMAFTAYSSASHAQENANVTVHVDLNASASEACKACLATNEPGDQDKFDFLCDSNDMDACKMEIKKECPMCDESIQGARLEDPAS